MSPSLEYRDPSGNFQPLDLGGSPVGAVAAYVGRTAPAGWHLCNGSAHGSAELEAVLGSANTPDLTRLFIVGVGPSYAAGATGGAETVKLTAAQSGRFSHKHNNFTSGNQSGQHSHTYTTNTVGGHNHGSSYRGTSVRNTDLSNTG